MKQREDQQLKTLADEIVAYLNDRPDAADTLDGIAQWWLIRQRYLRGLRQIQMALDFLVANGLVNETKSLGREIMYSAAITGHPHSWPEMEPPIGKTCNPSVDE